VSWKVKEKEHKHLEDNLFIPSLFRLMNNKPFIGLLIPWVLDILVSTIFGSMLPFYLNFVINPQKYCQDNGIDLKDDNCNVNIWLGYTISIFFIACILCMFLWHYFVSIYGKKKCWEAYSLISILTFSMFLMVDSSSMGMILFCSVACALPAGGAYLNDVFCSDIIDYDEFLTGKRNEGIYTVFSSFIPKIVSIFAQSIPLTIMACNILLDI
jgi:Na+/melibiose symporter-like transporter